MIHRLESRIGEVQSLDFSQFVDIRHEIRCESVFREIEGPEIAQVLLL